MNKAFFRVGRTYIGMKQRVILLGIVLLTSGIVSQGQTVDFSADTLTGCSGFIVTYTNRSKGFSGSEIYHWDFGAGANPSVSEEIDPPLVTYTYEESDPTPTITLTVTDGGTYTKTEVDYITVNPELPVSVSITADPSGAVCSGTSVTFTATPVNGGTTPLYQWYVNGTPAGTNLSTYQYIPGDGDVVTCELTSSEACATGSPATSNALTLTVNSLPEINITGYTTIIIGGTTNLSPTTGGSWTSNNPGVASVTDAGLVSGLTSGSSTFTFVTATTGCSSTSESINVVDIPSSFIPVWWPGNGQDHMNLYALTAILDGNDLQPSDAIGVFDADICVGVGILTEVLTGSNYLGIKVSQDDPDTPEIDGYISGNSITFKIWDASQRKEVSHTEAAYISGEGIFKVGESASFNLEGINTVNQLIDLTGGWNIFSFSTIPDDLSLRTIVDPLIVSGTLIKIQDEQGNAIEELPSPIGWIDNIGKMKLSEGYKIKVTENTSLNVIGVPVSSSQDIALVAGWNIIGYPFLSTQDALTVFDPLITAGTLLKVQDEQGNAIEELPSPIGWIDNIKNLKSGEGYKVKTTINTTLTINDAGKGNQLIQNYTLPQAVHFKPVFTGNGLDHMNLYVINHAINGPGLNPGDEIGVFDGDICVGASIVNEQNQNCIAVNASLDDPTTKNRDGFIEGHPFSVRIWEKREGIKTQSSTINVLNGYTIYFSKNATSVMTVDLKEVSGSYLFDAFPNPSDHITTFEFNTAEECHVRLEIINSLGNLVIILVDEILPEGVHTLEWNNRTASGIKAIPGIYYYRLTTNGSSMTKSLVINN